MLDNLEDEVVEEVPEAVFFIDEVAFSVLLAGLVPFLKSIYWADTKPLVPLSSETSTQSLVVEIMLRL